MIKLANVTKRFEDHVVLDNINLVLPEKGIVLIMGENGAGKSTLLNILGLMDTDFQGSYELDGTDVRKLKDADRADFRFSYFSYVFQSQNLIRYLSVEENLHLQELMENETKMVTSKTDWHHLSQGQQEQIALERELKPGKRVYLLDEVTANLDANHQQQVLSTIRQRRESSLVIAICHDLDLYGIADEILLLKNGHLEQVKEFAEHKDFLLSSPQKKRRRMVPKKLLFKKWKADGLIHFFVCLLSSLMLSLGLLGVNSTHPNLFGELSSASSNSSFLFVEPNDLVSAEQLLQRFPGEAYRSLEGKLVESDTVPEDGKIYCNQVAYDSLEISSLSDASIKREMEKNGYVIDNTISQPYFFIHRQAMKSEETNLMIPFSRNQLSYQGTLLKIPNCGFFDLINQNLLHSYFHKTIPFPLEEDVIYVPSSSPHRSRGSRFRL